MSDEAELDWKAVAQIAMLQRDRAEQKANNLEIDVAMARQQVNALTSKSATKECAGVG